MSIYIYNSLTGKKEEFQPLNSPQVTMYTCGVTVYDDCHIGHARSLYIFEVIKRYLKYRNYKVKFVRNITDIDDKIINKAKESGVSWQDVAEKFTGSYKEDLKLLEINMADQEPKATENIEDMIKHIKGLIDKGYAYDKDGDVYFSVRKFKDYGKLSGQLPDQMIMGTRKEPGENKIDPLDFALWKKSGDGESFWDSPWGNGRPGWHIECSTMSMKYLNTKTIDIHAGGRDLIFPHHENEIAQAQALTGKRFAKYWIHHGLLTINGQKMAKSLSNFVTIKDFMKKYDDADYLKLFFLSAHYRNPIDYTEERIEEAKKDKLKFRILINNIDRQLKNKELKNKNEEARKEIDDYKKKFEETMDDDFNTPQALAVLFNMVRHCNKLLDDYQDIYASTLQYAKKVIYELEKILGLSFEKSEFEQDSLTALYEMHGIMIEERNKARMAGDFKKADKIRKELEKEGIVLEDAKDGKTIPRRKL